MTAVRSRKDVTVFTNLLQPGSSYNSNRIHSSSNTCLLVFIFLLCIYVFYVFIYVLLFG